MAPTGAERFTITASANGGFIVTDIRAFRGQAVVLPDSAAVLRHCTNIINDERDRAEGVHMTKIAIECPGTGRPARSGTGRGRMICPVCHRGGRSIGLPVGKWRPGVIVPPHSARGK